MCRREQRVAQHAAAGEGMLEMQFVDAPHQRQILRIAGIAGVGEDFVDRSRDSDGFLQMNHGRTVTG